MAYPVPLANAKTWYSTSTKGVDTPHWGTDFLAPTGTDVYSVRAGTVYAKGTDPQRGLHIDISVIVGGQLIRVSYEHLKTGSVSLAAGDTVTEGQKIGEVGTTGSTTFSHLHLGASISQGKVTDDIINDPDRHSYTTFFPPDILWTGVPGYNAPPPDTQLSESQEYRAEIGIDS